MKTKGGSQAGDVAAAVTTTGHSGRDGSPGAAAPVSLVPAAIASRNVTIDPRGLHMEVFNPTDQSVWLYQHPITQAEFDAMKPEPPFLKTGIGRSGADQAYFLRSPGEMKEGPVTVRTIGGYPFALVARPLDFRGLSRGDDPALLHIDKHHVLCFQAGTCIRGALLPDGLHYLLQTDAGAGAPITPPPDWKMFTITLDVPWVWRMQAPAPIYFFRNFCSYAGRLRAHELPTGSLIRD